MESEHTPLTDAPKPRRARPASGAIAGAGIGALVAVFAVLNSQSVEVNWIVSSTRTPLIVVLVLFLLVGLAAGRVIGSVRPGRGRRRGR
ncbi:MAG: hypothetical protein ACR2KV_11145 [Solirubrobacteraceae bacterium]